MATEAQFAATPNIGSGNVATANTNRDGTGTITTLFTAGANGSKVNEIRAKATGQTAAGQLVFYVHDGTNYRVLFEVTVAAITPSATLASWEMTPVRFADLDLPSGYTIRASVTVAPVSGNLQPIVEGGNY